MLSCNVQFDYSDYNALYVCRDYGPPHKFVSFPVALEVGEISGAAHVQYHYPKQIHLFSIQVF
jgi:hypothetical protein